MTKPSRVLLIALFAGLGGVLFAQGSRPSVEDSAQNALISEVRALRAEIHQLAGAGIRTHLLVARLQLQEQRVLAAARQLGEIQAALVAVQGAISGERGRVRQLEDAGTRATPQGRVAINQAIADAGIQIEHQQMEEADLRQREKELLRAVDDAQIRWTDFSDRLDAIERSLWADASRSPN